MSYTISPILIWYQINVNDMKVFLTLVWSAWLVRSMARETTSGDQAWDPQAASVWGETILMHVNLTSLQSSEMR